MTKRQDDKSTSATTSPKNAQKGGQGAIGKGEKDAELNEKGRPGGEAKQK